ncbi:hypothetical protein MMC07_009765 [Pseudocyphellaria aurata]|nr:hypothetical protein [Pseudocyphellaria aurata]
MHIYRVTVLTLLLSHHIHAIEVSPGSDCSSLCDDSPMSDPDSGLSSHTHNEDLVCDDDDFSSTVIGRKFKECLTCELNSTATYGLENDAFWLMYNMRYNVDWCVFGYPNNFHVTEANSQCGNVCSGPGNSAKMALVDRALRYDFKLQFQYCQDEDRAFPKIVKDCMKCLNKVPKAKTLANFVNALNVGCVQQPQAGETLKLYFDVFAAVSTLNSSTSTASSAGFVTATVTSANPPSSSSAGIVTATVTPANPPSSSSAALAAPSSSGAVASASAAAPANTVRVGVGVGVGIGGAALVLTVTVIILFRRRSTHNRERFEREARARWEAEHLAAHGVPKNNHQLQQEQNVGVAELIAPDYTAGVAEFIAPDYWAGAAEFSAPDYVAEAGGRRLDPELAVKVQR